MSAAFFKGMMPALMTPCGADRRPDFDALVAKAAALMDTGMSAVIYCGSMGDWPLVSDADRMEGVARLTAAGIPVVVGTGAINSASATALAAHAQSVGAAGLMVIPRVLSRGPSATAQKNHFKSILGAAPDIPAVIYNSPFYGFSTRAELFFALREEHSNLVGFKEFGGAADLSSFNVYGTGTNSRLNIQSGTGGNPGVEMTTTDNVTRSLLRHVDVGTSGTELQMS
mgnify:CR=1 FL=1